MPDSTVGLSAFSLTHVLYDTSSTRAEFAALITLSPILLTPAYLSIIVCTRELTVINMFIGQCLNDGLNLVLKQCVKQKRPTGLLGKGYGFPSQHSQYMGYFSTFLILHIFIKHSFVSHGSRVAVPDKIQKLAISFVVWLWALGVCYSRYFLSYHTPEQVLAGYLFGVAWGLIYFFLIESSNTRTTVLRRDVLDSSFARWWMIKDGWAVYRDGGIEEEYNAWRSLWERSQGDCKKTK